MFKKVLITVVVVAAVGMAVLLVAVAVKHDRKVQQLREEAPAWMKENLELMQESHRKQGVL